MSIQADWIFNDPIGIEFLKELVKQGNKEIFETKYVKIITEFLYNKYSSWVKWTIMPLYFLNLVSIYTMVLLEDNLRRNENPKLETIKNITIYLTAILSSISFMVSIMQSI
jgi:hypothetical protein